MASTLFNRALSGAHRLVHTSLSQSQNQTIFVSFFNRRQFHFQADPLNKVYKILDCNYRALASSASEVRAGFATKSLDVNDPVVSADWLHSNLKDPDVKVKESFGMGKQESTGTSSESGSNDSTETLFGKFKSKIPTPNASTAFQKLKEAKFVDLAKKGLDIVKDELSSNPKKRKHLQQEPSSSPKVEKSTRTEVVFVPTKQSPWSKKWDAFKNKVQSHPVFKRIGVAADPVVTKGQEIAEDVRERWETSDSRIVHKIQDINETIFQETDAAATVKEIRSRDPTFSLPELVAEIQEIIKPVLTAYLKGDVETLKKYCTKEVVERCAAEHTAYQGHGIFFENKILHISDVEVRETKMMGASPIIIVAFQTQQVYCVRDKHGAITEGGQDTIHTVYYAWAMQQVDPAELGEDAIYPIWKLREMQQLGVQALI